jgi:membrane protein
VVALVVWILASVVFAFYVANFGSYNKTYGSLGGAISLLVWMWITNIAVLFGQELNAEIERGRELAAGKPAEREMQLPLRDEPKKDLEEEGAKISAEARREMQEQRADEQDDQRFEREDDRTANR